MQRPIATVLEKQALRVRVRPQTRQAGRKCMATVSNTTSEGGTTDPTVYCRDLVRKHDYESFLVSPFYPKGMQGGYFALKAFHIELAMIGDTVSNPIIGQMRMQFWRDAVKQITDGTPPRHPIALALYETSQYANVPPYHLKRIVDAREAELNTPTHLTSNSLIAHAESTQSTLLYLLLSLLNQSESTYTHAASHLGAAQCISTLLRALPYHASCRRMVIPAQITAKHGVSQESVFREGGSAKGLDDAVFAFATLANDHLITARDMFKETGGKVPQGVMPVFLSGIPVASFLGRLEAVNFDVFHRSLQLRHWKLPWRVWRGYYKRQF